MKLQAALTALTLFAPLTAQMAQPTKQHKLLAMQVGTWNAEMEYLDFDTGKPTKSKGVSIRKQPLGSFWLIDNFQANMMGAVFKGMGVTGYDPVKKKLVGTWVDSMSPSMMVIEGNFDEKGQVMTLSGTGTGVDGEPAKTTLKTTIHSRDKHVFEMFTQMPDGENMKMMTITYTRRTRKMDEVRK